MGRLASKPGVELLPLETLLRELLAVLGEVSRELSLVGKLSSARELLRELSWLLWYLAIRILWELSLELWVLRELSLELWILGKLSLELRILRELSLELGVLGELTLAGHLPLLEVGRKTLGLATRRRSLVP